jgi:mannose-6-phosphate isomerase-like protein (cupin superfamily)
MFVKGWQVPSVEVPPPNKRYLKVPMSPEVTGTHNATLLYSIISPGYTTGLHTHDGDEIQYIVSGRGEGTVGDKKSPVEPDMIIFSPRGVPHEIRNSGEETLKMLCIFAPPLKPSGYFEKAIEAAKKGMP